MDVTTIEYSRGKTRITLSDPRHDERPSGERRAPESHDDNAASYGVVYVNDVARHALMEQKKPQFPFGSVIVREKLAQANAATPELMVVMVKRERGFNKKANDWEFLMIDGNLSKITRREKKGSCRDCHKQQKDTDFVFRTYLPEATRLSQK